MSGLRYDIIRRVQAADGIVLSQARKDIASLRVAVEAGLGQVRASLS